MFWKPLARPPDSDECLIFCMSTFFYIVYALDRLKFPGNLPTSKPPGRSWAFLGTPGYPYEACKLSQPWKNPGKTWKI